MKTQTILAVSGIVALVAVVVYMNRGEKKSNVVGRPHGGRPHGGGYVNRGFGGYYGYPAYGYGYPPTMCIEKDITGKTRIEPCNLIYNVY